MTYKSRQKKAFANLAEGTEALLVTHLPDVRWLCGFTGSNAALVLVRGKAVLFTDGRYTSQAKSEAIGTRVIIGPRPSAVTACEWMTEKAAITTCGFDAAETSVAAYESMKKVLPAGMRRSFLKSSGPVVSALREVKDEGEIEVLRRVAALGCTLFDGMLDFIEPGLTETAVAAELEYRARKAGAERMSFDTIVASGPRSALPHGRASMAKLPKRGFCTIDFGVVLDGYLSDMTRTVHLGKALPGEWEAYEAVLEAQEAAIAAIAPGVSCAEVDEAARSVLKRAGLAKFFTHSTGHGVGLEIHEGPRLAVKQTQLLQAGMVITVEPGVYLPDRFGLRIEDMVLVTESGGEVLTTSPKAWIEL